MDVFGKSKEAQDILVEIKQKYPNGLSDAEQFSAERKAWLELALLRLSDCVISLRGENAFPSFRDIAERISHAEKAIGDSELRAMLGYVAENENPLKEFFLKNLNLH
ncbi:MAG: hypothetical protein IJ673_05005 [Treponema sp.]|nr:hypothetical protein [Treponema sp.]MBR1614823.1 hypothetical protein [Treponema sp.]